MSNQVSSSSQACNNFSSLVIDLVLTVEYHQRAVAESQKRAAVQLTVDSKINHPNRLRIGWATVQSLVTHQNSL